MYYELGHQLYQKIVVQSDCTGICTIPTLIKTTKPTSVLVRRPNSDLLFMPYYELSTWITTPTIKFPLIWSVVGPCGRNINRVLLVYRTPGIRPPY